MSKLVSMPTDGVHGARVVIAALVSAKDKAAAARLDRLESTLSTRGAEVVGRVVQRRGVSRASHPGGAHRLNEPMNRATIIGSGKVRELTSFAAEHSATIVVFLNHLNDHQRARLEHETGCRVVSADWVPS